MRAITTIIALAVSISASAKGNNMLKVMLSTGEPLTVQLNGRDYNKTGTAITIGDLPNGWHDLRVYRYREYKDGGGRAQLIYNGRVKLKNNTMRSFVVNPSRGTAKVYSGNVAEVKMSPPQQRPPSPPSRKAPTASMPARTTTAAYTLTDADMTEIALKIQEMPTDINTLKTLKAELEDETYTTTQLSAMMEWLAFDDSRIDLAKWSYSRVVDKENFASLEELLSMGEKKEMFRKWAERQ